MKFLDDKLTQIKARIVLAEVTRTPDESAARKNDNNGVPDVFHDAFKEDKDW